MHVPDSVEKILWISHTWMSFTKFLKTRKLFWEIRKRTLCNIPFVKLMPTATYNANPLTILTILTTSWKSLFSKGSKYFLIKWHGMDQIVGNFNFWIFFINKVKKPLTWLKLTGTLLADRGTKSYHFKLTLGGLKYY